MDPDYLSNLGSITDDNSSVDLSAYPTLSASTTLSNSIVNSSYNWGTLWNGTGGATISNSFFQNDSLDNNPLVKLILGHLSNKELDEFIEKIKNKHPDEDLFQRAIKAIIMSRHCTEEFIMKYLDTSKMSREDLWVLLTPHHYADVTSGDYAQLAVLAQLAD